MIEPLCVTFCLQYKASLRRTTPANADPTNSTIPEPTRVKVPMQYNELQTQPVIDNKLLEKINYMIYMLEQQQNEKTSNITEEFILYTFLGVFIIFIVDSFARSGKYIR